MFGFDNKVQSQQQQQAVLGAAPDPSAQQMNASTQPSMADAVATPPLMPSSQPINMPPDTSADEGMLNDDAPPAGVPPYIAEQPQPAQTPLPPASPSAEPQQQTTTLDNSQTDLLALKQQALQQLSPLVDQLEQSPEEKFKTTMMMIQASDDDSLIPVAYSAANAIADEKVKAQALLDIVNEINYFTQHQHQD